MSYHRHFVVIYCVFICDYIHVLLKKKISEYKIQFILALSKESLSSVFPTGSDINQAVDPQKMARGLKFWI